MCSVPEASSATQNATNGACMISPAACAMEVSTWLVSSDEVTRWLRRASVRSRVARISAAW